MEAARGFEKNQLDQQEHDNLMALRNVPWTEAIYFDGKTFSVMVAQYGSMISVTINDAGSIETVAILYDTQKKTPVGNCSDSCFAWFKDFLRGYQRVSRV